MTADVRVWWATLTSAHVGLLGVLDTTERSRLSTLDRPADRARSLLGAALLRRAASEEMEVAPEEVEVARECSGCGGPHGQPRIAGGPHVSLSHSGVLVVVATCWAAELGVDVQRSCDVDQGSARDWVRREAATKAGHEGAGVTVVDLHAPRPGYASALAVRAAGPPRLQAVDADACWG